MDLNFEYTGSLRSRSMDKRLKRVFRTSKRRKATVIEMDSANRIKRAFRSYRRRKSLEREIIDAVYRTEPLPANAPILLRLLSHVRFDPDRRQINSRLRAASVFLFKFVFRDGNEDMLGMLLGEFDTCTTLNLLQHLIYHSLPKSVENKNLQRVVGTLSFTEKCVDAFLRLYDFVSGTFVPGFIMQSPVLYIHHFLSSPNMASVGDLEKAITGLMGTQYTRIEIFRDQKQHGLLIAKLFSVPSFHNSRVIRAFLTENMLRFYTTWGTFPDVDVPEDLGSGDDTEFSLLALALLAEKGLLRSLQALGLKSGLSARLRSEKDFLPSILKKRYSLFSSSLGVLGKGAGGRLVSTAKEREATCWFAGIVAILEHFMSTTLSYSVVRKVLFSEDRWSRKLVQLLKVVLYNLTFEFLDRAEVGRFTLKDAILDSSGNFLLGLADLCVKENLDVNMQIQQVSINIKNVLVEDLEYAQTQGSGSYLERVREAREVFSRGYSTREQVHLVLLTASPVLVRFTPRMQLFYKSLISAINQDAPTSGGMFGMFDAPTRRTFEMNVKRENLMINTLVKIRNNFLRENSNGFTLRDLGRMRIKIKFTDLFNTEEMGIDSGGLYKEFLTLFFKDVFKPKFGLFRSNDLESYFPNPDSDVYYPRDSSEISYTDIYKVIGAMIGKAILDGQLVEIPLAGFVVKFLSGKSPSFQDLKYYDEDLLDNLVRLERGRDYVEDYDLYFVTGTKRMSKGQVPLKQGGENIKVTRENILEYIYRIANYYMVVEIREQLDALRSGLYEVLNFGNTPLSSLLGIFNEKELKVIMSGSSSNDIDVQDLRANTKYVGFDFKYKEDSKEREELRRRSKELIDNFWQVLEGFSNEELRRLLQFTTSSPKAPFLGFKYLMPNFTIQYGGDNEERLPSSSTCMNILRLPLYSTKEKLKEKLLKAIENVTGFGLS